MARNFNGSTDRIDYASAFDTTGQAITISLWAQFDQPTPGSSSYMFNSASSGGGPGLLLYVPAATNAIQFFRNGSGSQLDKTTTTGLFTNTGWYHILATHDGVMTTHSSVHIYINGTEPSYGGGTNGSSEVTSNSGFELGGRSSDDARNFDGRLAEIGVWNRVLAAGEIAALAARCAPSFFPRTLKFYPNLIQSPNGAWGIARTGTLDGTTVVAHPPMRYPGLVQIASAAGGTPPPPVAGPTLHVMTTGMRF